MVLDGPPASVADSKNGEWMRWSGYAKMNVILDCTGGEGIKGNL